MSIRIELPWERPPLSLNDRMRREHRAALTAKVRRDTGWVAKAARLGHHDHVTVVLHYQPARRGRRDADNLVATLKPVADALVDAGLVDDDDPAHMTKHMPVIAEPDPGQRHGRLWLDITPTGRVETPMTPDDCSGGDCVRVKVLPSGRRLIYSSRSDAREYVFIDPDEWAAFIADVKAGKYDGPPPQATRPDKSTAAPLRAASEAL